MRLTIFFLLLLCGQAASGADTLRVSRADAEQRFLSRNLTLLAEKRSVSQAEARIIQAKAWPNPHFGIDQVNLWATSRQTKGEVVVPPLGKTFGKNQQFAFDLDQLIETAGKRRKRVAIEQAGREQAEQGFLETLLSVKTEFRNLLTELSYDEQEKRLLEEQLTWLQDVLKAQERQYELRNSSKADFFRMKSLDLEWRRALVTKEAEIQESQQRLKTLLVLPPETYLILTDGPALPSYEKLKKEGFALFRETAGEEPPRLQRARADIRYAEAQHRYEQAKKVPDITVNAGYDRNGNTMLDFLGFGVSADIPVFDRNKGNILASKIEVEKAGYRLEEVRADWQNQLFRAYARFVAASDFYERLDPSYLGDLAELSGSVARNFQRKNLTLIEFLNYFEAFRENRETILGAAKDLRLSLEELNYLAGTDLL